GAVVQDLRRLSLMYGGLSIAYTETGELSQAAYYAQRSISIHETLNDRLSLARSENNLGRLLVKRGELAGAGEHLTRALALFDEAAIEVGRAEILLSLCELDIARSRLDAAETYSGEARTYRDRLSYKREPAGSLSSPGAARAAALFPAVCDYQNGYARPHLADCRSAQPRPG